MKRTLADRFWSKVDKSGSCWMWTGYRDKLGYGRVSVAGKPRSAHRVALELARGKPVLHVLHSCDTPACVNPAHLREGSQAENMADKIARGRHRGPRGEQVPSSRLTEKQVIEIMIKSRLGSGIRHLAREYGVRPYTIECIVNGRTWKHLGR